MKSILRCGHVLAMVSAAFMTIPWKAVRAHEAAHVGEASTIRAKPLHSGEQSVAKMSDIALSNGGLLTGQVFDTSGQTIANQEVALLQESNLLAVTVTDKMGRFHVRGVRGGTYQLVAAGQMQPVRAWTLRAAPPAALPAARIIMGDEVTRAQYGCGYAPGCGEAVGGGSGAGYQYGRYGNRPIIRWMRANPAIVITGIAAAIAIPVAIAAADDDDQS